MVKKLGPVNPDPAPAAAATQPQEGVGVVRMQEANRPQDKAPIGVVPAGHVVANVKPQGVAEPAFGQVNNVVSAAPPPPPPPKPIGVIEPEQTFPPAYVTPKPKIGALSDIVVTPAEVAANVPEPPSNAQPTVIIPNVVDPFEGKAEEKK